MLESDWSVASFALACPHPVRVVSTRETLLVFPLSPRESLDTWVFKLGGFVSGEGVRSVTNLSCQ